MLFFYRVHAYTVAELFHQLWDFGTSKRLWTISNERERIAAPGATQSAIVCIEENEVHVWDINALPQEPTAVLQSSTDAKCLLAYRLTPCVRAGVGN